jgi:hypothetical protein
MTRRAEEGAKRKSFVPAWKFCSHLQIARPVTLQTINGKSSSREELDNAPQ